MLLPQHGEKTQDLCDIPRLRRSGDCGPIHEGRGGSLGPREDLFHQGVAKGTNDPEMIAATMAHPGVVLRRPVGSNGPFREQAKLPDHLSTEGVTDAKLAQ